VRIPRDVSGADLASALRSLGYKCTRQEGSHLRLTTERHGQHHITVPNHRAVKLGTIRNILKAVANHHEITLDEVLRQLRF
jgi:predicted RNA binding protein YcfA (HicA-like mRNA interferase family)